VIRVFRRLIFPFAEPTNIGQPLQKCHAFGLQCFVIRGLAAFRSQLVLSRDWQLIDPRHTRSPRDRHRPFGSRRNEGLQRIFLDFLSSPLILNRLE